MYSMNWIPNVQPKEEDRKIKEEEESYFYEEDNQIIKKVSKDKSNILRLGIKSSTKDDFFIYSMEYVLRKFKNKQ